MKCTICDRCGKVIDRHEHVRTVTLTRPIHPPKDKNDGYCHGDHADRHPHPVPNDVVWQHDLCMNCADEVEKFAETVGEDVPAGGTEPGTETPGTTEETA